MTPEEQLRTVSERAGFFRTVSKGMYHKTGEDVDDGFEEFYCIMPRVHFYLGPIQILKQNFGYTSTQRLVLFLMSKLSVITTFMESRFRSPQHLETKPKFGWSYPEAQIVTWMSCDTENQKIFLKKLLKNVCKIKIKSIPKVKGQKTVFPFIKEFGRTCPPMNSVTDASGNPSLEICQ